MKEIELRTFDYARASEKLLTPEIVGLVGRLHEHKGKQDLFLEANADKLETLLDVALVQSVDSSNRIEGICTSDARLKSLVLQKTTPRNRPEQEIAGYREVLATVHESHDYIKLTPGVILQMHRDMLSFSGASSGGRFKDSDNIIAEIDAQGKPRTRFTPVAAHLTPQAVDSLCADVSSCWKRGEAEKLLLIPMFILDFLCIHPFLDGNGRMSRLLTLLLLYEADYVVGKYISVERLIENSRTTYYEALAASSAGWHENENDYAPFVRYCLGILLKAYGEFEDRAGYLRRGKLSKPQRVARAIEHHVGKVTKRELLELCPDVSKVTVERTLAELVKSGRIEKVGAGPATAYVCSAPEKSRVAIQEGDDFLTSGKAGRFTDGKSLVEAALK